MGSRLVGGVGRCKVSGTATQVRGGDDTNARPRMRQSPVIRSAKRITATLALAALIKGADIADIARRLGVPGAGGVRRIIEGRGVSHEAIYALEQDLRAKAVEDIYSTLVSEGGKTIERLRKLRDGAKSESVQLGACALILDRIMPRRMDTIASSGGKGTRITLTVEERDTALESLREAHMIEGDAIVKNPIEKVRQSKPPPSPSPSPSKPRSC